MAYNPEQKKRLKKLLLGISTPEEQDGMLSDETDDLSNGVAGVGSKVGEANDKLDALIDLVQDASQGAAQGKDVLSLQQELRGMRSETRRAIGSTAENSSEFQQALIKGLQELKQVLLRPQKSPIPEDWSGFFKDGPTMLSQIGQNTSNTSELIRNLKWNASQQIRDVNGSPVNPSIAPFGITGTYDDVVLAYTGSNLTGVTYKQGGQIKAVLALAYDGSSNLIEVTRTT